MPEQMSKIALAAGLQIGKWTLVRPAEPDKHGRQMWTCQCDCGRCVVVSAYSLRSGRSSRCTNCNPVKHGACRRGQTSRLFGVWQSMLQRCNNPRDAQYANYGGRGVKVCTRWLEYANFAQDMGQRPSDKHSIDRIDNGGNYEPANCRWALPAVQLRNKRNNIFLTHDGRTQVLSDWAKEYGLNAGTVYTRLMRLGKTGAALFAAPMRRGRGK